MDEHLKNESGTPPEKQSLFGVIVHSFFVIPFLIAVFCVLLFVGVRMLTAEKNTPIDYLEHIRTGGLTKRWQAAYELSKILANPNKAPQETAFYEGLITSYTKAKHDDDRIRQYLALAMGRSGRPEMIAPLLSGLTEEKIENLPAVIYALGMLQAKEAAIPLHSFLDHSDAEIRLATVIALGGIQSQTSVPYLTKALEDPEPNVGWDAAIALAKMNNTAGKAVLLNLLDRDFLNSFPEVDRQEQSHILQTVIQSVSKLKDPELNQLIKQLSESDANMNVRKVALAAIGS